jgi:uncharacterized protein with HXXEE motif
MTTAFAESARGESSEAVRQHVRAWLLLDASLAIHVCDEALTNFLDFYNPIVEQIRARIEWFPAPTFTFGVWLTALILGVILLAVLTPAVRRGMWGTVFASWFLVVLMLANGLGHLGGSIYFGRWLPGATSAPLLLAASATLAKATWTRTHSA